VCPDKAGSTCWVKCPSRANFSFQARSLTAGGTPLNGAAEPRRAVTKSDRRETAPKQVRGL